MTLNEHEKQDIIHQDVGQSKSYTKTLYVSLQGDNTDGLSWETAFTDIKLAWLAADSTGYTRINIGVGTFDIASVEVIKIERAVHMVGSGRYLTIIKNSLCVSEATAMFWVYKEGCKISNMGFSNPDGGSGPYCVKKGIEIENCRFNFDTGLSPVSGRSALSVDGDFSTVKNVEIVHDGQSYSNGLRFNYVDTGRIENVIIRNCGYGLITDGSGSINNVFKNIEFFDCKEGISASNGAGNMVEDCKFKDCITGIKVTSGCSKLSVIDSVFTHCDTNINDVGNETELARITSTIRNQIYPEDLTGVILPNSGTPETYGANTAIIPADIIDNPFKILAFTAAPSDDKKFIIRLSADGGVNHFMHMFERRDGNNGELSRTLVLHDTVFAKGTEISGSMMAEVGDETLEIWLYYQEI